MLALLVLNQKKLVTDCLEVLPTCTVFERLVSDLSLSKSILASYSTL